MLDEKEPVACALMARNFAYVHAVGPGKGRGMWWLHVEIERGTKFDIRRGNVLGIQRLSREVGRKEGNEGKWDWVIECPLLSWRGGSNLIFDNEKCQLLIGSSDL